MDDDRKLDETLAALTDAVLEGQAMTPREDLQGLDEVVNQLHQVIAPDEPADPTFRQRLQRRLDQEWNLVYRRRPRWYQNRTMRLVALAASLALVLTVVVLLLCGVGEQDGVSFPGTAAGALKGEALVILLMVAVGAVGAVALWIIRNRRH